MKSTKVLTPLFSALCLCSLSFAADPLPNILLSDDQSYKAVSCYPKTLDEGIGRVIEALRETGQLENKMSRVL